jgi:cytochrome c oxidase subunit III
MELGTVRISKTKAKTLRSRAGLGGFGGSAGGGQDGGGGSDDNGRSGQDTGSPFERMDLSLQKLRIVTWFLLLIVLMTFAGLVAAYIMISTNGVAEWTPFALPVQVWISTAVIVLSSVSYTISNRALQAGNQGSAKTFLLLTTVLGATFISSQMLAWLELVNRGYYLQSNPYAGFFYFITVLHVLHVLGGIVALGFAVLRTWEPTRSREELERRQEISKSVGQYWHFMDGLWIVLVLLLGFWK